MNRIRRVSREEAVDAARQYFDQGGFEAALAQRVAHATVSQEPDPSETLKAYLQQEIEPTLTGMGFECRIVPNPIEGKGPFLLASRAEPGAAFTLLSYGHGDVVRGYEAQWKEGLNPWRMEIRGDQWFGRGTADNKGQHTINLAALEHTLKARNGKLGYGVKFIFEMGEETGSPGLREVCAAHREFLAADVFLASDGPRVSAKKPTLFLGSRGNFNFTLEIKAREGSHHSGNWGGLLSNPGIRLANAIAALVTPDGQIKVKGLLPSQLPENVRRALVKIELGTNPGDPAIDPNWGEPGLTPAERVIAWNSFEVLAFKTGNPDAPVNAIPGYAVAHCQLRYVVHSDYQNFIEHMRAHLDANGFKDVQITPTRDRAPATRLDPDNPWVHRVLQSIAKTTGKDVDLLPNLGGSLPNDAFSEILGLPTIWVPHSYAGCAQHAPGEHLLGSIAREGLALMTGVFWDLGEKELDCPAESKN